LYGAFAWARRALNGRKRRFPARADTVAVVPLPINLSAFSSVAELLKVIITHH
jgi:hypothetical protein